MSRTSNIRVRRTRPPKGGAWFWSMFLAVMALGMIVACTSGPGLALFAAQSSEVESYPLCVIDPHEYANAPCVVLNRNQDSTDGYVWVAVASDNTLSFVEMPRCEMEDGPAPCVWDAFNRGNGRAGPGVQQFVMVR